MKHTKRLFSVLLTLCLLLGILPTTVWASYLAEITQQPTAENNYTVKAAAGPNELTEGFQWWKKISVPETYNLVEEDPEEGELGVAFVYNYGGHYTDGHWVAEDDVFSDTPLYSVSIDYITSPGDQVTVRIPPEMVNDNLTVKNGFGDSFQKTGDGVYTDTFDDDGRIFIESGSEFTAVITVDRYWTAMAGETTPSLSTREPGSYYCVVSHESGDLMSDTVTFLSPEEQATIDWLADTNNHMLVLGPVVVTEDNYDDIFRGVPEAVASGTASFEVVNGTPTLTLDGVNVTEGYPLDIIEVGLLCSDDLTIVLADGSDNKITVSSDGIAMGIMTGDLSYFPPVTVTGAGTLTVSPSASASDSNNMCFGVYAGGIHVTGGAEFTVTAVHDDEEACFGLTIGSEEDLKVSDGGVVRISSIGTAIAFNESASDIDADGYSIQGSTTANNFTNLADADAVLKEVDGSTGKIFVLTVNDEFAKSVVIAPIPPHNHTWDGAWTTNDTHHWHACTAAGCPVTDDADKDGYAAHTGGTATCTDKAVCSACGSSYGQLTPHDFTGDYLSDENKHWRKCKTCTEIDAEAAHSYDDDQDDTCNVCNYVRTGPHTHAWSGDWTTNETHHWHACTAAGCPVTDNAQKDGYAAHIYDNDQDTTCNDCGYVRTIAPSHTHAWSGDWTTSETHHWHACTAAGCPVTDNAQKGGYAVHVEDSGTVTRPVTETESGVKTFKCTVCGRVLRTEDIPAHTYSISGTVTGKKENQEEGAVEGAEIKLMQGGTQVGQTIITGADGKYSFSNIPAGIYNVVAAQESEGEKITKTILVVLTHSDATEKNIKMPDGKKNSVVEVKSGAPDVVVGGVDEVAEAQDVSSGQTVTVKLTVEKKEEHAAAGAADIKRIARGKTVEFLELSLVKEVTGGSNNGTTSITDTKDKVLEIVVPYNFSGKNSVTVYRHHDGKAEALTPANTKAKGTFRLDETSGLIYIYATKFSTYAIGYAASGSETPDPTPTPPSGGSSGGGSSSPATYPPTVDTAEHGKVTVSPRNPGQGETVTVTLTPDNGYQIAGVIVTDRNGRPVTVTDRGGGTYTFIQPTGKVTIHASFKPISDAASSCPKDRTCPIWIYEDSDLGAWYHDGVHYCLEHGLMVGMDSYTFAPDSSTSRAMVAAILWRLEGSPVVNFSLPFSDVPGGVWYTEPVRWSVASGIVSGYGDGTFGPGDSITREQLAVMLWHCAGSPAAHRTLSFTDTDRIGGYALEAVRWAVENGIVIGHSDGRFDPQGLTTRAQAASMLQRFCEREP